MKPLQQFRDTCLYCGHTWWAVNYSDKPAAFLAYKLKVKEYIHHRKLCMVEWFKKDEERRKAQK